MLLYNHIIGKFLQNPDNEVRGLVVEFYDDYVCKAGMLEQVVDSS